MEKKNFELAIKQNAKKQEKLIKSQLKNSTFKIINEVITGPIPYTDKKIQSLIENIKKDSQVLYYKYGKKYSNCFTTIFCHIRYSSIESINYIYFEKKMMPVMLLAIPLMNSEHIYAIIPWIGVFKNIVETGCTIDELYMVLKEILLLYDKKSDPSNLNHIQKLKRKYLLIIIKYIYEGNNNFDRKTKINYIKKLIDIFFTTNMRDDIGEMNEFETSFIKEKIKDNSINKKLKNYGFIF